MTKTFKSEALESIHESASALQAIGAISKATMREFDESCLAQVPDEIAPEQIKQLRERNHVSQPVFARYLNTSASTVKQWEAGGGAQIAEHRAEIRLADIGLTLAAIA